MAQAGLDFNLLSGPEATMASLPYTSPACLAGLNGFQRLLAEGPCVKGITHGAGHQMDAAAEAVGSGTLKRGLSWLGNNMD